MRMDALTLKQLRALQAVAAQGSLTGAAEVLGQTTPAIHSQIKNMETALGRPVLLRGAEGGRSQLTPDGAEMLRAADRIEAILSQAASQMTARSAGRIGHVVLSVVSTAKYFAPRLVRLLNESCPEIEIALRVGNREAVIADLDQGRCAMAVMGRPPRMPDLRSVPLGPHPHGIILPPDHPLAGKDGYDPAALLAETFLCREPGSGTRILMQRFLDRLTGSQPARLVEMDSNETIKQAVLAGLGIAFLSLHTVYEELRAGRLVTLAGPQLPVMRHWYLVAPGHVAQSAVADRISTEIVALNGTYLPPAALSG